MTYKFDTNNLNAAITVRLQPRIKYLLLLALRIKRQTLCRFVTECIIDELSNMMEDEMIDRMWDTDPEQRFLKLAIYAPELLTYEEQVKWKEIRKSNGFT